ncbi:MAG: Rpn family recombination-promoting nuclease/putative transposase [Lachnospiraceae bacterium]|nr:Rpn family recombination-promoting nuclease/putative transposase [Lachnospiraceae bacterium]
MGKADSYSKDLMQRDEYFADTVNNTVFEGKVVVRPEELTELDTTELTIVETVVNDSVPVQKYRDVLKQAVIRKDDKAIYAIIGIENQTTVHYAMPVKCLLYDSIRYAKQVEKTAAAHRKKKTRRASGAEFLSGWYKEDKLLPIITITVYFGAEEWDGPKSIHEMFEDTVDESILKIVPNYEIHLLEPRKVVDWDSFQSDIGLLFHAIAVANENRGIDELFLRQPDKFKRVDNRIVNAIDFFTHSKYSVNSEEEETDMSYAAKTSEAHAIIGAFVDIGKTLEETIEYLSKRFKNDKDINKEYITEEYNSCLRAKNK